MGDANPRSFSRGKRGIAGSLTFTIFDRDALAAIKAGSDVYRHSWNTGGMPSGQGVRAAHEDANIERWVKRENPHYADEIPPLTLCA